MCIEAPESTTNALPSGVVEDGAGGLQTGVKNVKSFEIFVSFESLKSF